MRMDDTRSMNQNKRSLAAQDWAQAALVAIARDGVAAVAVEALARELEVTKGSFYWHFPSREALINAAFKLWEKHETDDMLGRVGTETDPYRRIVRAFTKIDGSQRASRLYLALSAASSTHPAAGAAVRRVSQRRLDYLNTCYEALPMAPAEARRWAAHAYACYLGILQLRRDVPSALPDYDSQEYQSYMQHLIATLIPAHAVPDPVASKVA